MFNCKRTVIIALFAALPFVILNGCELNGSAGSKQANLSSTIDSVSYGIGHLYGSQMQKQGMTDLKTDKFIVGFNQGLEGADAQLDQQTVQQLLQAYQIKAQQNAQRMKKEESDKNMEAGQTFLDENISEEGVNMTESGMQYKVIEEGTGESPSADDTVRVHYVGNLVDGTVFDTSIKEVAEENDIYNPQREPYEPVEFPLNRVIPGWTEGLQLMKEGATYKFWIPGDLAYGQNPPSGSPISPGELLVFEIELVEVK